MFNAARVKVQTSTRDLPKESPHPEVKPPTKSFWPPSEHYGATRDAALPPKKRASSRTIQLT